MTAKVLQLNDVRLLRAEREVLAGVTFSVPRGEIVTLMGPSGSGKNYGAQIDRRSGAVPIGQRADRRSGDVRQRRHSGEHCARAAS